MVHFELFDLFCSYSTYLPLIFPRNSYSIGIKGSIFSRNSPHHTGIFRPLEQAILHNEDMAKTWNKTTWKTRMIWISLYIFCLSTYNLSMPLVTFFQLVPRLCQTEIRQLRMPLARLCSVGLAPRVSVSDLWDKQVT